MKPRNNKGQFIKGGGYKLSEEHKRKISESKKGFGRGVRLSLNRRRAISKGMKLATAHMKSKRLAGDYLYQSSHKWMQRWYGQPQKCDSCGRTNPPHGKGKKDYFHWANKDGRYLKERKYWMRLCAKCHRNYDFVGHSNK